MYAFMADLHIGTKLSNIDYLKSLDKFLSIIKHHKEECHGIFVCGDVFDHKMTIEESRFAGLFLLNLTCNNCGRNGKQHVPVYFIHGTYSHDYEQYEIYLQLLQKIDNVEIFYTNETKTGILNNGKKILFLPQIYGDFDYSPFFNSEYDIIIGHGPISSTTKSPCKSTQYEILHSAEQLGSISKICVFGHYHSFTDFGNNVFYVGPWLRWRYNEDEKRVFFICDDNFKVECIPNEFALEYKTIEIHDPETLRDIISSDISTPHRFIINDSNKENLVTYHSIMNMNKNNTNIKYKIQTEEQSDDIKTTSNIDDKTNDAVDNTSNIVEPIPALISYISDKYNIDVSIDIQSYESKINKE